MSVNDDLFACINVITNNTNMYLVEAHKLVCCRKIQCIKTKKINKIKKKSNFVFVSPSPCRPHYLGTPVLCLDILYNAASKYFLKSVMVCTASVKKLAIGIICHHFKYL